MQPWGPTVLVFLCLLDFTQHKVPQSYPHCLKWQEALPFRVRMLHVLYPFSFWWPLKLLSYTSTVITAEMCVIYSFNNHLLSQYIIQVFWLNPVWQLLPGLCSTGLSHKHALQLPILFLWSSPLEMPSLLLEDFSNSGWVGGPFVSLLLPCMVSTDAASVLEKWPPWGQALEPWPWQP